MNLTREKIESVNLNTGLTKITEAEKRKMKRAQGIYGQEEQRMNMGVSESEERKEQRTC